jgi:hypothetical protein
MIQARSSWRRRKKLPPAAKKKLVLLETERQRVCGTLARAEPGVVIRRVESPGEYAA